MDRFIRFGLVVGVAGGALLALGSGLALVTAGGQPLSVQTTTTAFVLASALRLLGAVGMVLGITGLVALCSERGGRFLMTAYALAIGGLALNIGWIWCDLFISDTVAKLAPAVLDSATSQGTRLDTGALLAWIANATLLVLAAAVARTRTVRRSSWLTLAAAGAITLVPLPFDGPVYEVLIGVLFALAALLALTGSSVRTAVEPRAAASQVV
ncbi:hypothetical protein [Longivirga aurantiaca]|uniref:DUF4386 family protein n=1 Tax=Longivirga aurantiaca TaxID=1837743 RepID=A0ABW1SXV3_9ACTN